MVRIRDEQVNQVREMADIVSIIGEYVRLKRSGRNYMGLCPFHEEKTPSFSVSREKGMFYCFGCQEGGDVFAFLMKKEGLSFVEAVVEAGKRSGIEVVLEDSAGDPEEVRRRETRMKMMAKAADYFKRCLRSAGPKVSKYLAQRGLDPRTVERFEIGYSLPGWDNLTKALSSSRQSLKTAEELGLVVAGKQGGYYDRFRGRLMFPIKNSRGEVIAFGGRVLGDGSPKYLNSPETPLFKKRNVLYAFDLARGPMRQTREAFIVEGYMDAITMHQHGFENAVASLGTSLSEEQVRLLAPLVERVFIAYDADAAGEKATLRGLELLSRAGLEVRIVRFPEGEDPDSFLRKAGAEAFKRLTGESLGLFEFRLELAMAKNNFDSPEGKLKVLRELIPVLARMNSPLERATYQELAATRLEVDLDALRRETDLFIRRYQKEGPRHKTSVNRNNRTRPEIEKVAKSAPAAVIRAGNELLRHMIDDNRLAIRVGEDLGADYFVSMEQIALARKIIEAARDSGDLVGRLDGPEARLFAALVNTQSEGIGPQDCINVLKQHKMRRRFEEIQAEIRNRESKGEEIDRSLLEEWQELCRSLKG